jgi:hypothetical protein
MQPSLGSFTIPIGDILQQTYVDRDEEKEEGEHIIKELKRII